MRSSPVATLRTVTFAPETTAPDGSVTVPRMVPRKVCAVTVGAAKKARANQAKIVEANIVRTLIDFFSLKLLPTTIKEFCAVRPSQMRFDSCGSGNYSPATANFTVKCFTANNEK